MVTWSLAVSLGASGVCNSLAISPADSDWRSAAVICSWASWHGEMWRWWTWWWWSSLSWGWPGYKRGAWGCTRVAGTFPALPHIWKSWERVKHWWLLPSPSPHSLEYKSYFQDKRWLERGREEGRQHNSSTLSMLGTRALHLVILIDFMSKGYSGMWCETLFPGVSEGIFRSD